MKENKAINSLAIGIAISLVIAAVFGGIYFLVWKGPKEVAGATKDGVIEAANKGYDLFKRAGGDIYRALQFEPKVTIGGGETVYGPAIQITEITTATKDFSTTYPYKVTWAGSTKELELKGDFTAKAGFPIDGSFMMEISKDGSKITLQHKEPQLLSCEMKKLYVLKDSDGFWNKLTPQERESAQNGLLRRARERALDADLKATATERLLERLKPLQEKYSFTTESEVLP
jgi:hypothetical protein